MPLCLGFIAANAAADEAARIAARARRARQLVGKEILGETTQQGTPFYPAGMSAADWSTLVFTLPRRKIAWVHPPKATFFQNCTLILDKYPVVSENETLPPAISPAEITLRSRQRTPKYTSSRAKHTVRNRHQGPASSSSA